MPERYQDTLQTPSSRPAMNGSRVPLPPHAERPFQVFVNGVEKTEGRDFEVEGASIVFAEQLVPPRRDTMKTYARLMFWGRYKTEHSVDLVYQRGGRRQVASKLEILPPGAPI
jgi:hypothetical protein